MIKYRVREIVIGMSLVMLVMFMGFYFEGAADTGSKGAIGYAVHEEAVQSNDVIIAGMEFMVKINGKAYWYMFADDGKWYESMDELRWELRENTGRDLWTGLYNLKSYGAEIYFDGEEIRDMTEFAKRVR